MNQQIQETLTEGIRSSLQNRYGGFNLVTNLSIEVVSVEYHVAVLFPARGPRVTFCVKIYAVEDDLGSMFFEASTILVGNVWEIYNPDTMIQEVFGYILSTLLKRVYNTTKILLLLSDEDQA